MQITSTHDFIKAVLKICARLLAHANVKSVGRVQIVNHSPVWRVRFSFLENYLSLNIENL